MGPGQRPLRRNPRQSGQWNRTSCLASRRPGELDGEKLFSAALKCQCNLFKVRSIKTLRPSLFRYSYMKCQRHLDRLQPILKVQEEPLIDAKLRLTLLLQDVEAVPQSRLSLVSKSHHLFYLRIDPLQINLPGKPVEQCQSLRSPA